MDRVLTYFAFNSQTMMQLTVRETLYDIFETLPSNDTALLLGEWQTIMLSMMNQGFVGGVIDANQTLSEPPDFTALPFDDADQTAGDMPDFAALPFDRDVIIGSYEQLFGELYELMGAELTWNATPFIASAIDMLQYWNVSAVAPLLLHLILRNLHPSILHHQIQN